MQFLVSSNNVQYTVSVSSIQLVEKYKLEVFASQHLYEKKSLIALSC